MDIRLDGKVALVTGASRGIGAAIAAALATSGASVMVSSRKLDDLEATAAHIRDQVATSPLPAEQEAPRVAVFAANACEPDQAEACVADTVARLGGLDILVNNAATNPYFGPTLEIDPSRFDKTVQVNWRGPLTWTQAAWRATMRDGGGTVLNIASIGGLSTETHLAIYNGTKAALMHLTRSLALEMAPGVRVNALAPGLVKTDMARVLWEPNEAAMARHTPLGRLGEPVDIANAAVFLCSDEAAWMTGTTTVVDGGALLRGAG
jgi:NAD(P)-dependent dehydrogenase (short-subunit alcohol dehydrogenase family)